VTLADIIAECDRVLALGLTRVQLVLAGRRLGRSDRVRLCGRSGPLSIDIACETERGVVAWWDAATLRAWAVSR
jgi:hypothetical protein